MITVKNIATGEVKNVYNVEIDANGVITPNDGKKRSLRFIVGNADAVTLVSDEPQSFKLNDGWEVCKKKATKNNTEKAAKKAAKETTPAPETPEIPEAPAQDVEDVPEAEVIPADDASELTTDDLALILSLKRMRGTSFDRAKAKELVLDVLNELAADEAGKKVIKKATKKATKKADVIRCEDFEDMVEDVRDGFNVYMYGAAGCGKSFTAEMIAEELGIPFYGTMQLEFEHQLAGYGDAAGRYVGTPFYQAMIEGGLFFLDEFDRSNQQITTVINTVMESHKFTFPVVGEVIAHPNFRIIAAGNTTMTGLNDEYVGAQVLCASTRNRFEFYEMKYDRRVELPTMAGGDEVLMNFVEDIRQSIADAQIQLIVSYRTTKYLHARSDKKAKALKRGLFQGLDADTVRTIYGGLKDKDNEWAKAVKKLF